MIVGVYLQRPIPILRCLGTRIFDKSLLCQSYAKRGVHVSIMSEQKTPAPGVKGNFDFSSFTPEFINTETDKLITQLRSGYEKVPTLPLDVDLLKHIAALGRDRATYGSPLDFPQHAAVDKDIRESSSEAEQKLEEFDVEMSMRVDIFNHVVKFKDEGGLYDELSAEQKRFVDKLIKHGQRNGLHLSDEVQQQVKQLKKRMSELCIKFQRNLNEDNTKLFFTKDDLAGTSDDFLESLTEADGKLEVTLKYPHLFPITKKCRVPETRRKVVAASQAKCMAENTPILEELVELRQKQADLLGYPNHAAFIQEERMAKTPEAVSEFLQTLAKKLEPLWLKEKQDMLDLKKGECEKFNYEYSGTLDFWDFRYYMCMIEEKLYSVDQAEVRQYFPLETVTEGLLGIYQLLLGLKFSHMPQAPTWHPDVNMYEVRDAESDEHLGNFFLDLYPREGKFGHAAIFPLQPSCDGEGGQRQVAVCAMMCNFTKPTKDKPALLDHSELETYFHEFGHVMHHICSRVDFAMFSGTKVERDFLEAPSQMLENWVWEKEPLNTMSGHYESKEKLPDSLVEKLSLSRKANAGGFNLRQIILATFDQRIHTRAKADTAQLFAQTYRDIIDIAPIPKTNMPANFGHLAGGYDAQYYGYLWSEVYSMDMYDSRFKKEGMMNPQVGKDYRVKILQPGGSKDASEMLRDFLGREPTHDAFLKSKGLSS